MTNAEARFNKSLRPRKPEGSLGRTAQDVHLDSHTAPELCALRPQTIRLIRDGDRVYDGVGLNVLECRAGMLGTKQSSRLCASPYTILERNSGLLAALNRVNTINRFGRN